MTGDDSRYRGARALFEAYAEEPRRFWGQQGGAERQSRKLHTFLNGWAKELGVDSKAVLSRAASIASERAGKRPPPIYVMGIGGSGSHWLASMLAQLVPSVSVGEVHIPAGLVEAMEPLPAEEQGFLVDCVHLLHTQDRQLWNDSNVARSARVVNAADGVIHSGFRSWDPKCCIVHLLRDPRDRTMSVVFRKPGFRQAQYPDLSDEEYLVRQARGAAQNFAGWQSSPLSPDLLCRYEELRASTAEMLGRIMAILGEPADVDRLAQVAREHDASLIRGGATPPSRTSPRLPAAGPRRNAPTPAWRSWSGSTTASSGRSWACSRACSKSAPIRANGTIAPTSSRAAEAEGHLTAERAQVVGDEGADRSAVFGRPDPRRPVEMAPSPKRAGRVGA